MRGMVDSHTTHDHPTGRPQTLMERVRHAIRLRHYSHRTEEAYVYWIRRYIVFHKKQHPSAMGAPEVSAFLEWLAVRQRVSASTQNQALCALLFLHREVLRHDIGAIQQVPRARTPVRLPVVLSREEVGRLLNALTGVPWIIVALLYGAGLRLQDGIELRVKDVDFDLNQIVIRRGKGQKDRRTMLPAAVRERLRAHLADVKQQHERDLVAGVGRAVLPFALDRKYPAASTEWKWQFVFPAARICRNRRWGPPSRFHLHESVVQKAMAAAARAAGITKLLGPHSMRHYAGSRTMPSSFVTRHVVRPMTDVDSA
jgi:integron integrase